MEHLPSPVGPATMYFPVGGAFKCGGYYRKSADNDIFGIFEVLSDNDDDDDEDPMCRVWVMVSLPKADRDFIAAQ